jgi:hypothetical protein
MLHNVPHNLCGTISNSSYLIRAFRQLICLSAPVQINLPLDSTCPYRKYWRLDLLALHQHFSSVRRHLTEASVWPRLLRGHHIKRRPGHVILSSMKVPKNDEFKYLAWAALGVAVLGLSQGQSDNGSTYEQLGQRARVFASFEENFGDPTSPGTWANFISAQAGHTDLSSSIPSVYLPRFTPSLSFSKMIVCQRSEVAKCMYRGEVLIPNSLE